MNKKIAVRAFLSGLVLLALTFSCKEKIDNEDGPSGMPPTGSPYGSGAIMAYSTFDFSSYCSYMTVMVDTMTAYISSKSVGSVDCQSAEVAHFPGLSGAKRHMVFINCGSLYWIDSVYAGDPCSVMPVHYADVYPGYAIFSVFVKEYNLPSPMNLTVSVDGVPLGNLTQTTASAECGEPGTVTSYPLTLGQHHWEVRDFANNKVSDTISDFSEGCNLWYFNKWE